MSDLEDLLEKRVSVQIHGNRQVAGILKGYDSFMNLVLEQVYDETKDPVFIGSSIVRGTSVLNISLKNAESKQ